MDWTNVVGNLPPNNGLCENCSKTLDKVAELCDTCKKEDLISSAIRLINFEGERTEYDCRGGVILYDRKNF